MKEPTKFLFSARHSDLKKIIPLRNHSPVRLGIVGFVHLPAAAGEMALAIEKELGQGQLTHGDPGKCWNLAIANT